MNPPLALAMLALGHMGRTPILARQHGATQRRPPVAAPSRDAGEPRPGIQLEIAGLAERFLRDRK
jgi:hypothetical protein